MPEKILDLMLEYAKSRKGFFVGRVIEDIDMIVPYSIGECVLYQEDFPSVRGIRKSGKDDKLTIHRLKEGKLADTLYNVSKDKIAKIDD